LSSSHDKHKDTVRLGNELNAVYELGLFQTATFSGFNTESILFSFISKVEFFEKMYGLRLKPGKTATLFIRAIMEIRKSAYDLERSPYEILNDMEDNMVEKIQLRIGGRKKWTEHQNEKLVQL